MATFEEVKKYIAQIEELENKFKLFQIPNKNIIVSSTIIAPRWWPREFHIGSKPSRTFGNEITPLIDGQEMMSHLYDAFEKAKHYIYIIGWHIDPVMCLKRGGINFFPKIDYESTFLRTIERANRKGVRVCIVLWHSLLWDTLSIRDKLRQVGAKVRLYKPLTQALHQKCAVIDGNIAFCGGIDVTTIYYDRWDTNDHFPNDLRRVSPTGPIALRSYDNWHDVHMKIEGPAAETIEQNFHERWKRGQGDKYNKIGGPPVLAKKDGITATVIRTILQKTGKSRGEKADCSYIESYAIAIINAKHYIYIEDQYFDCEYLTELIKKYLRRRKNLHLIVLLPKKIELEFLWNSMKRIKSLKAVAPDRVAFYSPVINNEEESTIYVHSKIMIVDDVWASIGSANFFDRAMEGYKEEELGVMWTDFRPKGNSIRQFRERIWSEHLQINLKDKKTSRELFKLWEQMKGKGVHRMIIDFPL